MVIQRARRDAGHAGAGRAGFSAACAAALIAAGLAGCGGSSSASQAAAVGTNASERTPVSSSTPASASTSAAGAGKIATPGTSLGAGQPATVSFQTETSSGGNGPAYKLDVAVKSIRKGSLKDFNGIQLDANEKASTPYYAQVRITNLGPGAINTSSNDPAVSVEGIDDTGNTQESVTFLGTFPPCPDADTPNPFRAGQSFQTCLTYLVPGGITKVAYTGSDAYETSPVTWSVK
jgi:hypothetical protein